MASKNQCDGCQAGLPLVSLKMGRFVVDKNGDTHIMNPHYWQDPEHQYPNLQACQKHRYMNSDLDK